MAVTEIDWISVLLRLVEEDAELDNESAELTKHDCNFICICDAKSEAAEEGADGLTTDMSSTA